MSTFIDAKTDLVYSPDDEGWYFARYPDGATSQLFDSEGDAREALAGLAVEWS